jgi:hypothetical protein
MNNIYRIDGVDILETYKTNLGWSWWSAWSSFFGNVAIVI